MPDRCLVIVAASAELLLGWSEAPRLAGPDPSIPIRCWWLPAVRRRPKPPPSWKLSDMTRPHQLCHGPAPLHPFPSPRLVERLEAGGLDVAEHPENLDLQIIASTRPYAVPMDFYWRDLLYIAEQVFLTPAGLQILPQPGVSRSPQFLSGGIQASAHLRG